MEEAGHLKAKGMISRMDEAVMALRSGYVHLHTRIWYHLR